MERYAYYVCFKCGKAYFGGEARCDIEAGGDSFNPEELVCGGCSDVSQVRIAVTAKKTSLICTVLSTLQNIGNYTFCTVCTNFLENV